MRAWVPETWRPDSWTRLVCKVLSWRIQSQAGFLFFSTFQWRAWDLKKNVRNAGAGPHGSELVPPLKAMMYREHPSSLFPKGVPRSYSSLPTLRSPQSTTMEDNVHCGSIQFTFPWLGDSCESIRHLLSPPLFVLELQSCLFDSEGVLFILQEGLGLKGILCDSMGHTAASTMRFFFIVSGLHFLFVFIFCLLVCFQIFGFCFFVFQGRLYWQRTDVKGQGNKWDQDVWCEMHRESVKAEKIDR